MAVNYGIGGFENGIAFGAASLPTPELITISGIGIYKNITTWQSIELGNGDQFSIFSNLYHQIAITPSRIIPASSGMYLVSYNVTTSGASNDNLSIGLDLNTSVINESITKVYSRNGDQYESGSSTIVYMVDGDILTLSLANLSSGTNITADKANIIVQKLKYSGRINNTA